MWFENFERHRANELEEQGAKRYNLNMEEAERETNPTDLPKEKLEAQEKQREKQEKQQRKSKQKKPVKTRFKNLLEGSQNRSGTLQKVPKTGSCSASAIS